MNFKSVSVNNCYILGEEIFENQFFTYINSKAIYSASIFHLAFFKGNISTIPSEQIKEYQKLSIDLYQLNSPYLYIPFEVNFHENKLYQAYYESDHFPLSLWIEEKSLIPFNIFIGIMEDILNALKILEKSGHSHLFITPEEILIPLQWDSSKHARLYNIGINLLAPAVLSPKEIDAYRNNYSQDSSKNLEKGLIKNISNDLYSFGMIMNLIFASCNFDTEKNKEKIQKKLNIIIKNPESFNCIDDAISLFDDLFIEKNRINILPENYINSSYTGQAGFIIPEFNEWQPEAELEPFTEDFKNIADPKIVPSNNRKVPFFKSVSNLFRKLFSRKKPENNVSRTLADYSKPDIPFSNSGTERYAKQNSEGIIIPDINDISQESEILITRENTAKILEEIKNHYKDVTKDTTGSSFLLKKEVPIKPSNVVSDRENLVNRETPGRTDDTDGFEHDRESFFINFNNSLEERNYARSYEMIKESIEEKNRPDQKIIISQLKKQLDEKLRKLDDHYIITGTTDILGSLAMLNAIQPMEITAENKDLIADLESIIIQEDENLLAEQIEPEKKLNIILRILRYLKAKLKSLGSK